jgi:hypothetical protein
VAEPEQEIRGARRELAAHLGELRHDAGSILGDDARNARREEIAERTRRTGWCLGVLAAARGVDLLRSRHVAEGLRWLVAALGRARGFEIVPRA